MTSEHFHPSDDVLIAFALDELDAFPHRLFTLDLKDLRTSAVKPLCVLLQTSDRPVGAAVVHVHDLVV